MTAETPAVEVDGLVKRFGDFCAVDGLSFRVGRGECFGILGPNGAGKTTTIRAIYGYSPSTAGSIRVLGMDAATQRREINARLGVCQQDNNLDPDLTVQQNLVVFSRYFDIPREAAKKRAAELLQFAALESRAADPVTRLSGGMMRRMVLARALINNPELLILDEPTTGLDPQSRHQLWDRLRALRAKGLTVLLTTHYMDEAERLCDRLLIMDHGKLLVEGAPADLIREHVGRQVIEIAEPDDGVRQFMKEKSIRMDDLGHRIIAYGGDGDTDAAFHELTKRICTGSCMLRLATLEDVFLRLTGRELRE